MIKIKKLLVANRGEISLRIMRTAPLSYTHGRAHEIKAHLVCRLLLATTNIHFF